MAKKKFTLEQALRRLEEIAAQMERADITLEDSLAIYKEGVELSVLCAEKIEGARQEVVALRKRADGFAEEQVEYE